MIEPNDWVPLHLQRETSIVQFNHWTPLTPVTDAVLKLIEDKKSIFTGFMNNPAELYEGITVTAQARTVDSISDGFDLVEKLSTFNFVFMYGLYPHEGKWKIRFGLVSKVNF